MDHPNMLRRTIDKLKGFKNIEFIVAILIIAIIISIYTSTLNESSSSIERDTKAQEGLHWVDKDMTDEERQEERLKKVLSSIKGAGRVEVLITYKSGKEIIPATNTVQSTTTTEELDNDGGTRKINQMDINKEPVTMNYPDGSKPLVLKEVEPEIKGVIVIAEGAGDIRVKLELLRAVQVALGVKVNQVEVFPMEKSIAEE